MTNYPKLIYIYVNYKDDSDIGLLIKRIFEDIAGNYEIKEKLQRDL